MDIRTMVLNSISTIRPQDIVDIIIVAFLLYKLFQLVRDSNGGQVLKGVLLIVVATPIAGWLGFNMLKFILESTLQLGIIALVILFQPELRRMLDQVGSSKLPKLLHMNPNIQKEEIERVISQITEATGALAWARTGALIVIERNSRLSDISKTGTSIDSDISAQLIKNIFYPKAPLHDGAIIIRGGRIAAAACVLPLSENTGLSSDLGTRHRAAVGVSEKTDSVAVVVSEETGSVSVAVGGMLKRHLTHDVLEKILYTELIPINDSSNQKNKNLRRRKKDEDKD